MYIIILSKATSMRYVVSQHMPNFFSMMAGGGGGGSLSL